MTLPPLTPDTILRDVRVDDHRLQLWETGRYDSMGKPHIAYRLIAPDGEVIFEGDDYRTGIMTCIDSDEAVRGILGFLTLREGDVEDDYFDNYTPRQITFREERAEDLMMYSLDPDDEFPAMDLPDWS